MTNMKPKQVSKCITRLTYTTASGIKRMVLKNHLFNSDDVCTKCGIEVDGASQLIADQQKSTKPPFEVGDVVCRDGLFNKEVKIVNRISKTSDGWIMHVDEYQWPNTYHIIQWCKLTSTNGWYKV